MIHNYSLSEIFWGRSRNHAEFFVPNLLPFVLQFYPSTVKWKLPHFYLSCLVSSCLVSSCHWKKCGVTKSVHYEIGTHTEAPNALSTRGNLVRIKNGCIRKCKKTGMQISYNTMRVHYNLGAPMDCLATPNGY